MVSSVQEDLYMFVYRKTDGVMYRENQKVDFFPETGISKLRWSSMCCGIVCLLFLLLVLNRCQFHDKGNDGHSRFTLLKGLGSGEVQTIPFDSLIATDPYILADEATRTYYLTGSGGTMWKSPDLKSWEGPYSYIEIDTTSWMGSDPMIWAPELHHYNGKYYCLVTFTNTNIIVDTVPQRCDVLRRATHILVAERAEGPYHPLSEMFYLPEEWSTLDGTLFEEEGVPYLVFNHDWMQLENGEIKRIALTEDLSRTEGEATTLFYGTDASWTRDMQSIGELTFGMSLSGYVTDGPFLFRTGTGRLGMLWSSWSDNRYAQGVAYSLTGRLQGPWEQQEQPLVSENAGHGMLFTTFEGKELLLLHYQPLEEYPGPRRPKLLEVDRSGDALQIKGRYNP